MTTTQRHAVRSEISSDWGDLDRLSEKFADQCEPTLGVEIENFIVSKSNGRGVPIFDEVRAQLPSEFGEQIHEEFLRSQIEYVTRPHLRVGTLRNELIGYVTVAKSAAAKFGCELAWKATLPDLRFDSMAITDNDRSAVLLSRFGKLAANLQTCGQHVHVAVGRENAIRVVDAMTTLVPLLVALSANSPRIASRNDVRASQRAAIWAHSFPTSGFPHRFGDWDGFLDHVRNLRRAGVIQGQKDIYHFVRPTRHGTVEMRCFDLPRNVDMVVNLAALTQTLVVAVQECDGFELPFDTLHADLSNATRFGRQAQLTGFDGRRVSVAELLETICQRVEPVATQLGTSVYLERLGRSAVNPDPVVPAVPHTSKTFESGHHLIHLLQSGAIFAAGCMMPGFFS